MNKRIIKNLFRWSDKVLYKDYKNYVFYIYAGKSFHREYAIKNGKVFYE